MINFPNNPTVNQTFTANNIVWQWDGVKWIASGVSIAYLPLLGGTLTGPLILFEDPLVNMEAVTKQYVDNKRWGHNRLINGDMRIDQRNNGAAVLGTAAVTYTVDRWVYNSNVAGHFTWGRNGGGSGVAGPPLFPYCLGVANAASAYTPAVGDIFQFFQAIEADMINDFAWGTVNAQTVTLSFWVYSNQTGLFSGTITNYGQTRSYPFTYSIPTANTWTKIIITIPGDTAGAWVMSGNAGSLYFRLDLGCGGTYRTATTGWQAGIFVGVVGAVQLVTTASSTFYFTGAKLEGGSIATPFQFETLSKRMSDCQRYYQVIQNQILGAYQPAAGSMWAPLSYMTTMRAVPTCVFSGVGYTNSSGIAIGGLTAQGTWVTCAVTAVGNATCTYTASLNAEI